MEFSSIFLSLNKSNEELLKILNIDSKINHIENKNSTLTEIQQKIIS